MATIEKDPKCDFCGMHEMLEYVDGLTSKGLWATMCLPCFSENRVGFGMGRGQHFTWIDGRFQKVEG